ncbi:hypothetical protein ACKLNQ_18520 [Myroides odoratimimus]|uniref:hypothetical protein n=1 Tax=Myroides odoratimimus TaxID=76832 RepID=UPI0038D40022
MGTSLLGNRLWDGVDGKSFTYSDFTQEQLAGLKGDKGVDGVDGKSAFDIWKEVTNNPLISF